MTTRALQLLANTTISGVSKASVKGLVRRDQTSKSVPQNTVNTVIAVTIILGVLFIAFALFVIYWMYMRSIDRKERRDRARRTHAQLEMSRKQKSPPSETSQNDRRSRGDALVEKDRRPRRGNGRSRGKCKSVIMLFPLINITDQGGLKGIRRWTLRTRNP